MLGETHARAGATAQVRGNVAYMAQQPWIQNLTLRDNVIFADAEGKGQARHAPSRLLTRCAIYLMLLLVRRGVAS